MSLNKKEQQTIALGGVAQAARLVDQISKTGSYPREFLEPSIKSLFAQRLSSPQRQFLRDTRKFVDQARGLDWNTLSKLDETRARLGISINKAEKVLKKEEYKNMTVE